MRKILLATNASEIKTSAVDFGCFIANLSQSLLTGVFIENTKKKEMAEALVPAGDEEYEALNDRGITANENIFFNRCLHNETKHSIHHRE